MLTASSRCRRFSRPGSTSSSKPLCSKAWLEQFKADADGEKVSMQEQNKADMVALQEETKRTVASMQALLDAQALKIDAEMQAGRQENDRVKTERNLLGELGGALAQLAEKLDGSKTVAIQKIKGPDGRMIGGRVIQADGTSRDVGIQ
jgi:hypothetical protein